MPQLNPRSSLGTHSNNSRVVSAETLLRAWAEPREFFQRRNILLAEKRPTKLSEKEILAFFGVAFMRKSQKRAVTAEKILIIVKIVSLIVGIILNLLLIAEKLGTNDNAGCELAPTAIKQQEQPLTPNNSQKH